MQEVNIAGKKKTDDSFSAQIIFDLAVRGGAITDSKGHPLTNSRVVASKTQSIYGLDSMYFDGNAWLTMPNTAPDFWLPGAFTIEAHVFSLIPNRSFPALFGNYTTWPNANAFQLFAAHSNGNANNRYSTAMAGSFPSLLSTTNVRFNAWDHVAVTRNNSGGMAMWVNGKQEGPTVTNATSLFGTKDIIAIGSPSDGVSAGGLNGYLNGLRVTSACRYTATFIPTKF